jgi:hypothetical protein
MSMQPQLFASAELPGEGLGGCISSTVWSCRTYCSPCIYLSWLCPLPPFNA